MAAEFCRYPLETGIQIYPKVNLYTGIKTMTAITVSLPDDRLQKLKEIAMRLGIAPEELIRISIEELLSRPEEEFRRALEYVLDKNAELYRRLA